ncbi:hypothetical protein C5167_023872 [Papaver somniferum]|uniref:Uncharacterized protein n=1 Tax=Papaver somniferum TaxID=3469 RepID=A0A4Y7JQ62_PAPSO|nr:hypothetical protein C5167_023872 [Papaver somniferum]
MWLVDDLESFRVRPYDDVPRGALFSGPNFAFLDDVLDSTSSSLDDDDWDFIVMSTPGFIPGYFEGKCCAVEYNVYRVARQLGYDQGLASIQTPMFPADDDDLMKECYHRFLFNPNGPRLCRDRPFSLSVPSPKVPPKFTQAWCTNWYDELTRMIEFRNHLSIIETLLFFVIGLLDGEALSPQNSFSSPGSQGIIMGRSEQPMDQSNWKRRRHQSGQVMSGSRYPDPTPLPTIDSPNSLVGQATWFDFKGNAAAVASTYAHFLSVYNFPYLRN